jgi:hypothetical protein
MYAWRQASGYPHEGTLFGSGQKAGVLAGMTAADVDWTM